MLSNRCQHSPDALATDIVHRRRRSSLRLQQPALPTMRMGSMLMMHRANSRPAHMSCDQGHPHQYPAKLPDTKNLAGVEDRVEQGLAAELRSCCERRKEERQRMGRACMRASCASRCSLEESVVLSGAASGWLTSTPGDAAPGLSSPGAGPATENRRAPSVFSTCTTSMNVLYTACSRRPGVPALSATLRTAATAEPYRLAAAAPFLAALIASEGRHVLGLCRNHCKVWLSSHGVHERLRS